MGFKLRVAFCKFVDVSAGAGKGDVPVGTGKLS